MEARIEEAEARLGIRLPGDLRECYRAFDGTRNEVGEMLWRFWPLAELTLEDFGPWRFGALAGERALHLYFCDALIWCPRYAVCVDPLRASDTEVWMVMGDKPDERNAYYSCAGVTRFLELFSTMFDAAVISETSGPDSAVVDLTAGQNSGCHRPEI